MELDSSFRDDYPFISSLFSDNLIKSDFENGFSSPENSSSKGLFHNLHNSFDRINESSFANPHHLNRFILEGSSKNPLTKISITSFDPVETYTNVFLAPENAYTSIPFLPNSANGVLHGSEGREFWDCSERFSAQPTKRTQIHQPALMNFKESGSSRLPDELSCVTVENAYHQDQTRYKRVDLRKERKFPKKNNIIKGQWTPQEDKMLIRLVARYGTKKWSQIAKEMTGRVGKQCRERWYNHLKPDIKKEAWSEEEDIILIRAHKEVGNKWAEIARRLSGRTENTIKNHWNATKRRQHSKRKHKETAASNTLLQNYIKDVTSPQSARKVRGNNNASADSNNFDAVNQTTLHNSQSQPEIRSNLITPAPDWQLAPVYYHNEAAIGGFSYETNVLSDGYNFSLLLDEMPSACSIVESNMEFDMPMETDGNYMPEEVKREMELMEMAYICRSLK